MNVCKMLHGSHLYGLDTEKSDIDYKGIFIPSIDDLFLNKFKDEIRRSTGKPDCKNNPGDIDNVMFSLHKFIKMACDGETIAIDMIHCNDKNLIESSDIWVDIVKNRSRFYTKNMKAFMGYCKKQAAKYGIKGSRLDAMEKFYDIVAFIEKNERLDIVRSEIEKLAFDNEHVKVSEYFMKGDKKIDRPHVEICGSKYDFTSRVEQVATSIKAKYDGYGERAKLAKDNQGIDWKAVSHAIRAAYQLREIYITGDLIYPLKDRDLILDIKQGKMDYTSEVAPILEGAIDEVERLAMSSSYPEFVDRKWWDDWIIDTIKNEYGVK